ncbi:MAG: ScpA family protein [Patescibacteria group bacterium]
MGVSYKLQQFEGPLDVLLRLIEDEQLTITDVSLAQVTEQFMQYLQQIEQRYPEELADFLVVATRLLLLKSQALLPYLVIEEEEDPNQLTRQLKIYKAYVDAMKYVAARLASKAFLYQRTSSLLSGIGPVFAPPPDTSADVLREVFEQVLDELAPVVRIPKAAIEKVVSLREKICHITDLIEKEAQLSFKHLMSTAGSKTEVVITFLALLELIKQRVVCVSQDKPFSDIVIQKPV